MSKTEILALLAANEFRCMDSEDDRAALADVLARAVDAALDRVIEQVATFVEGSGTEPHRVVLAAHIRAAEWA